MPETLKSLQAKRDSLLQRADGLSRTDPQMAKYLRDLAGEMDSELEGTDEIQERDANGFLQGEDPDYLAHHEAQGRISGQDASVDIPELRRSPTYLGTVEQKIGEQLQNDFSNRMNGQMPKSGIQVWDNSVTPSAESLKQILYPE